MRGLIVDELNHVLLALLQFPARSVWVLPGGGIEADEEHHDVHFESSESGASLTFPQQAGTIRKSAHLVIKGRPCKVADVSTSKTGEL